jgi:hypothetical protein
MLGALLFSLPLFSQGNFGRILGTVADQTGGVISGATVSIIDKDRGVARTLTTDDAGEYNAPTLIPGTYTVRAEAKGFKTIERQNILLEVGKEVRVDLTVQPGEQTQSVTVTEAIPLVETTNATLGGTLNNSQIQDLPLNGRNYQYLLSLRPGVMVQPGGGPWTQSTNNIRPDESAWMVDGVINASFYDARPVTGASSFITDGATILPIDAIQEFNLEENPKAEYGWKPGAVVNVGIRSGTNTLHGSAYAFGRDASFDARNIFNPGPDATGNCGQPACAKLPLQLEQFGGAVGGPIKKDKLFFFANYEGMRSFIGNAFSASVPGTASFAGTPSGADPANSMVDAINGVVAHGKAVSPVSLALMGCSNPAAGPVTCTGGLIQNAPTTSTNYLSTFPTNNTRNNGIAKLDYRINSKHMLNGMLWVGRYTGVGEDHPMVNSNFVDTVEIPNWTTVVNWVWTPSSTVVNEAKLGYSRNGQKLLPFDRNVLADGSGLTGGAGYALNTGITSDGGFPTVTIQGFTARLGSWNGRPVENGPNPFYDFTDSVSYLKGKHSFKFGGEYGHIETDSAVHDTRGRIDFRSKHRAFLGSTSLEDFFAGKPDRAFQLVGNANRTMRWYDVAGFVQDDWRVTSKVIVNLGLRYSYTSPLREANDLVGNFNPALGLVQQGQSSVGNTLWKPDYRDFSPRLGFAWDVSGKGTTVVRAGASIIYSSFATASFLQQAGLSNFTGGTLGGIPTGGCSVPVVGAGATCLTTPGGSLLSPGGTIQLGTVQYSGPSRSALSWNGLLFPGGSVSCTASAQCNILAVDPNLHTPYITNWNLSVTRAFTNNLSLEVGYVGNHGTRLGGFTDINQCIVPNTGTCVRPYAASFPYLKYINMDSNYGFSNYNSMQATLTERVTHGLNFTAGYTYGHGLDNGSENRFGPLTQDSNNPRAQYASGDFDVRNRFTFTTGYEIPGKKGFGQLLEGWKVNSIVSVQSAQPWNIGDTANDYSTGGNGGDLNDHWDFFGNPKDFKSGSSSIPYCAGFNPANINDLSGVTCTTTSGISGLVTTLPSSLGAQCAAHAQDVNHINTLAGNTALNIPAGGCYVEGGSSMIPNALGQFGTMGRNIFRDNGFRNWDLSLFKTFTFKERYSAQFRFEVFDILNKATISNPNGANNGSHNGDDPGATKGNTSAFGGGAQTPDFATGNPIIGSGGNRAIQLGLKLTF